MIRCALGEGHIDQRGEIRDLLVEPLDSVTMVYSRKGAVRGNHYHAKTHQWVFILSGKLRIVSQDVAEPGVREAVFSTGDLMLSPPLDSHAWEALEDTTALVMTRGPRSGENYEQDTIRLDEPLIG